MAVAYFSSDTLTGIRTPLCRTSLFGLAQSRNVGIALASGDYVVFVDSDDVVSPDHLEHLVQGVALEGIDVALCRTWQYFGPENRKNQVYALARGVHPAEEILRAGLNYDLLPSAWGKIVRRELYDAVTYEPGILYEDMVPFAKILGAVERVAFVSGTYTYMMRRQSIQHRGFDPGQLDKVTQALAVRDLVRGTSFDVERAATHLVVSCCFNTLSKLPGGPRWAAERAWMERIVREHRADVLRDRSARLKARGACALSYVSFSLLERLYGSFKSI